MFLICLHAQLAAIHCVSGGREVVDTAHTICRIQTTYFFGLVQYIIMVIGIVVYKAHMKVSKGAVMADTLELRFCRAGGAYFR